MKARQPFALFLSLLLVAILTYGCCCLKHVHHVPPPPAMTKLPPPLPAPASEEAKLAWFKQAKYGLFIHWGLYSIPAGDWDGKRVPGIGEWIMHNAPIPVTQYEQLAKQFDPVDFNAEQWVTMAQAAGMKYIVITAKHHDGFAMYHSLVSPYNIYDATPFHRDPIRELAQACARHHMKFGFYYSQSQDWHEPGGMGNTNDFGPDSVKDESGAYDHYLKTKAEPQVAELLQNYGPICLIWFDTARDMSVNGRGQAFIDLVHKYQPACLIDGRLGVAGDYVSTGDNAIPNEGISTNYWETPATINHTWGYRTDDTDWKSPGDIIFKLVDITSKGGNYLLNVGPTSLGVIPAECQSNLLTVGRWLKAYGDVVYGAGPSPFGEEFGEFSATTKDHNGNPVFLTRSDWRCTTKPGKLYFTLFNIPRDGMVDLPNFKNEITKAYIVGDPDQTPILIDETNGVRVAHVPRNGPNAIAYPICLEISPGTVEK
ncbi:MAG TPA: alpha-L-fucosidase [Candidatus Aquilonibacter sp.]|nr:alpha-L-fucosidase [Candidatus Aquilonibacter sp.]